MSIPQSELIAAKLISLSNALDDAVAQSFDDFPMFQRARNKGFEDVIIVSVFIDDARDLQDKMQQFRIHNNYNALPILSDHIEIIGLLYF